MANFMKMLVGVGLHVFDDKFDVVAFQDNSKN